MQEFSQIVLYSISVVAAVAAVVVAAVEVEAAVVWDHSSNQFG